ncbi:DODA-type extradiol aromatic ring-opening family dioxygenase [Leeia oryzae]|uniref:DODA-type extradiol aromatic ring-opening family dioxygenase n=1 Tax=Leeia oryzae TaxID=356662 RepID=UPI000361219F|nr:class III extradiol ring-cleavage dioxygenase [Leeia oryzae]
MQQRSLFVSHGAPDILLEPGTWGSMLSAYGQMLTGIRAVLVVSAHWQTRGLTVTAAPAPETIHDFGSFPEALYDMHYPAKGAPELARHIASMLTQQGWLTSVDAWRGLDHGAWVPLMQLLPEGDIPVLQLSMPQQLNAEGAYRLGQALAPLTHEGVLVVGSGCLTHNVKEYRQKLQDDAGYVTAFTEWVRDRVMMSDRQGLLKTLEEAPFASRAHPTPEHFLPLLIAMGAAGEEARPTVLETGIQHQVLSLESYAWSVANHPDTFRAC